MWLQLALVALMTEQEFVNAINDWPSNVPKWLIPNWSTSGQIFANHEKQKKCSSWDDVLNFKSEIDTSNPEEKKRKEIYDSVDEYTSKHRSTFCMLVRNSGGNDVIHQLWKEVLNKSVGGHLGLILAPNEIPWTFPYWLYHRSSKAPLIKYADILAVAINFKDEKSPFFESLSPSERKNKLMDFKKSIKILESLDQVANLSKESHLAKENLLNNGLTITKHLKYKYQEMEREAEIYDNYYKSPGHIKNWEVSYLCHAIYEVLQLVASSEYALHQYMAAIVNIILPEVVFDHEDAKGKVRHIKAGLKRENGM
jgi:hypothetical protein